MRHVLSALVQNQPGVLAHVSGMLASRGFNIDSLAVGETEMPHLARMTFTVNGDEADLRTHLHAPARHADQALYVSGALKTGRVMVKDEDVCLHCGLCAERCPTGAWDMQKFMITQTRAGHGCRSKGTGAGVTKKVALLK